MTKSKKILTLIAALTLAVSITACGPSNNGARLHRQTKPEIREIRALAKM